MGVSLEARNDGGAGSIIATVQPGSPAEQAGVLIGDIVLAVDGEPVNGQAGLVAAIRDRTPGIRSVLIWYGIGNASPCRPFWLRARRISCTLPTRLTAG